MSAASGLQGGPPIAAANPLLDPETLAEIEEKGSPEAVLEAVGALLESAAQVNAAREDTGDTPLHVAAREGCAEVCRWAAGSASLAQAPAPGRPRTLPCLPPP